MFALRHALAAALLVVPASCLLACASNGADADSGATDLTGGSSTSSAGGCGAQPTVDTCVACCIGNGPDPLKASKDASLACAQKAGQKCGSACVTWITDSEPGTGKAPSSAFDPNETNAPDPCAPCLDDLATCSSAGEKACTADPTCAAANKCMLDAQCDAKPDPNR
jgi:hypothetical protein